MEDNNFVKTPLKDRNKDIEVYDDFLLTIYDHFVLSFCCPLIWRCSKNTILKLYNEYVSNNHLDIGVGTGFFLDQCRFPDQQPRISLLDLSENCLRRTAKRIERYTPESFQADIYEELPLADRQYDSIALNYVLHCLPGTIDDKAVVFKNINRHLSPGGTVFGATVIGQGIPMNFFAKKLMKLYNDKGIFCNSEDSLTGLNEALHSHYQKVEIKLSGCVALFVASN